MAYKDPQDPRLLEKRRAHYYANKEQYFKRNQKAKKERRLWLIQLKEQSPCMDCKQFYPYYVMDFDHRDGTTKVSTVSQLITYSWQKLKTEISKCDLVCANCHRERTHKRHLETMG